MPSEPATTSHPTAIVDPDAIIGAGCRVGHWVHVSSGAVVKEDVPEHALEVGVPARPIGCMSRHGERIPPPLQGSGRWWCPHMAVEYELAGTRMRLVATGSLALVMQDFVLFTNTQWTQAPRLRHQVARLLAQAGHRVTFFETPAPPWQAVDRSPREIEPRIRLISSRQLLHHQLRVARPLQWWNERFVLGEIRRSLPGDVDPARCTVINFRYEYGFAREAFPGRPFLTIIHDNFEAQCRLPWRGHITRSIARTCRASDRVFVVSTPLQRRLSQWCRPELFLPWSVEAYRAPAPDMTTRRDLAFWGYVDTAVDLTMVRRVAAELRERGEGGRVLLIGPTEKAPRRRRIVESLANEPNVEVRDRTDLDRLPLDRLLGAILPYVDSESVRSVTLANKSMQLLARGLPLLISSMPEFVRQPFILRLDGDEPISSVLERCRAGFTGWQTGIESFVRANSPESRLKQLGVTADGGTEV